MENLRARTLLCMSKDLGWRISDFLSTLKIEVKPLLKRKPPASFRKLTKKEKVPAYSFLSNESLQCMHAWPRRPNTSPLLMVSDTSSRATFNLNFFVKLLISTIDMRFHQLHACYTKVFPVIFSQNQVFFLP